MNTDAIRKLYKKNKAASAFFDHAAKRTYGQNETKVDRILQVLQDEGHELTRSEIIDLFRVLEEQNLGRFVVGRRKWPSRFIWSVSIISVGKAATGESDEVQELPEEKAEDSEDTVTHIYRLRDDFLLELKIPADLTINESKRLSLFVRSLPIEEGEDDA